MNKLDNLIKFLKTLIQTKFTGSITIHLGQGGICNVEKKETLIIN